MTTRNQKPKTPAILKLGVLIFLFVLAAGCSDQGNPSEVDPTPSVMPLPPPETYITKVPDAEITASDFLNAWESEDYASMYSMLSPASQASFSEEELTKY